MSFQKVVKRSICFSISDTSFRTVSFQKVVKLVYALECILARFRTVSFQKVVKRKLKRLFL